MELWDPSVLAIAFGIVVIGCAVQAAAGIGLGLIAAPILLLLDARWVPGPLLAAGMVMATGVAVRERGDIHWRGFRFAIGGRAIGSTLAASLLTLLSPNEFDLIFGGLVLLAVGLSLAGWSVTPTPGHATAAGLLSGFMSTLSSIGGPPIALLYQRESGPRVRSTLSALFVAGGAISITALSLVGRYGRVELQLTAFLVPAAVLGFVCARWLHAIVERAGVRPLVLGLSAASALAVVIRAVC